MLIIIFDQIATTETVGYYGGLLIESTLQRDAKDYGISLEERHVLQVTFQFTINRRNPSSRTLLMPGITWTSGSATLRAPTAPR